MIGTRVALATTLAAHRLAVPLAGSVVALVLAATSVTGATGWTGPRLVGPAADCSDVAAAIDAGGGYHVVAAPVT